MSRATRLGTALALSVGWALHAVASGLYLLDLPLLAVTLGIGLSRRALPSLGALEGLLSLLGATAGVAVGTLWGQSQVLSQVVSSELWSSVCLSSLFVALLRLAIKKPQYGHEATLGLGLLSVAAIGLTHVGPVYLVGVAAYLAVAVATLLDHPALPEGKKLSRRFRAGLVGMGLVAFVVFGFWAAVLPPLYEASLQGLGGAFSGSTTAFSTRLRLGSMVSMTQSSEKVLRVYGKGGDYLRGVVYSEYERGRWRVKSSLSPSRSPLETIEGTRSSAQIDITPTGGDRRRYFVPLGAGQVALHAGAARVDEMGIVFPLPREDTGPIRVTLNQGGHQSLSVAPPTAQDLDVPPPIRDQIEALMLQWTDGAESPSAKIRALSSHLRNNFEYSLESRSARRLDPVISFLTRHKRGHCEYFASALALLARSAGIPTRVVGGYRVVERNSIGGYYLVRQSHAHAWVEAWLPDERWHTVDATPSDGATAAQLETPWAEAVLDSFAAWLSRARYWVTSLSPTTLIIAGAALLALWLLGRRLWRRRRTKKRHGPRHDALAYDDPMPAFDRFCHRLKGSGLTRRRGETVEAFAERVLSTLGPQKGAAPASLIISYGAHRYGGQGEATELSEELDRWAPS